MLCTPRTKKVGLALAVVAVGAAVALGFVLRLADPLSSPVIPAEDPYTHMALVKEHLRTGSLEPLYIHSSLYPPGLHAFLATAWSYSGIDLYQVILLGPVFLGAIGVLGIALFVWRNQGPLAGFVGALALAVAPEAIFRTNMMSPTALDLALLPYLLVALLELIKGKHGWLGVAAPMSLFFVFSHPWLFPILTMTGLVFVALALLVPWQARFPKISPLGVAGALACIGGGLGLTLTTCAGLCGPGLRDILTLPTTSLFSTLPYLLIVTSLVPLVLLVARPRLRARTLAWKGNMERPLWLRITASLAIAAALLLGTLPALGHLPDFVDLPKMFGWPILVLAFAALVAVPFLRSPAAYAGAGLFASTYPFVIYNPLHSPFWPHRTAVFLGLGLVVLCGAAAGGMARGITLLWERFIATRAQETHASTTARRIPHPGSHALLLLALISVPALVGGAVYAGTPDGYSGGWYRMYPPCEMEALRAVAAAADADPKAIVMTGDWEAKLVLASLATDASRVWYKQTFFTLDTSRSDSMAQFEHQGRNVIAVVDRYVKVETPDAQLAFLDDAPFHSMGTWCSNTGTGQSRMMAYTTAAPGAGP